MKVLYLMRHGETLFNTQKKIQGWCDSPLTENGIHQAQVAGKYFADHGITFDHAYSSTSERACDTLEQVLAASGQTDLPYERVKGLKEWNFGRFEGKDECLNPPLPYGDFFATYGGEKQTEVIERIRTTIADLMARDNHDSVLMVSHGGIAANFAKSWDEAARVHFTRGFKNCGIFRFEVEDGRFILTDIIYHEF